MNEHKSAAPEDALQQRIVALLNQQADRLDPRSRHALDRARRKALDAGSTRSSRWSLPSVWIAAPALLMLALVLLPIITRVAPNAANEPPPMTADLDIITDPRFELAIEDPAFILWLTESDSSDAGMEYSG